MGFNIKNNYGPNIEVNDGGKVTLIQGKNGLWNTADAEEAEYKEVVEVVSQPDNEQPRDDEISLSPSRRAILDLLLDLADKGEWQKGVTADHVKAMLKRVLGLGETPLTGKEALIIGI